MSPHSTSVFIPDAPLVKRTRLDDASTSATSPPSPADSAVAFQTSRERPQPLRLSATAIAAAVSAPPTHGFFAQSRQADQDVAVRCEVRTRIPSAYGGEHHVLLYSNDQDGQEHLALVWGYGTELVRGRSDGPRLLSASLEAAHSADETLDDRLVRGCHIPSVPSQDVPPAIAANEADPVLARIHSCCFTGETLGSLRCDCQEQLHAAMQQMATAGRGVIVYLAQEGRGIGLRNKLRAYNLIDRRRLDTLDANLQLGLPADARSYSVAAAILRDLGVDRVALLTNNPEKIAALAADSRIAVQSRIAMTPASWEDKDHGSRIDDRDGYLIAKAKRMGHMIDVPNSVLDGVAAASSV